MSDFNLDGFLHKINEIKNKNPGRFPIKVTGVEDIKLDIDDLLKDDDKPFYIKSSEWKASLYDRYLYNAYLMIVLEMGDDEFITHELKESRDDWIYDELI